MRERLSNGTILTIIHTTRSAIEVALEGRPHVFQDPRTKLKGRNKSWILNFASNKFSR
jgi:hypothetical protein